MLHQIGVGALGPVFRTYEPTRDRLVAVKVFRLDITPEQARALADELARAADAGLFHPSIVEPVAAGIEGTVAYRAEEYVAAESLDVAMRHYAPAAVDKMLPFITQLASAIDFARAAGVGHGALHPRDIFVTPDEARATGFGVVDALDRMGLRAPVRRPYSPPERIAGRAWSTPADVFSLAAIAFELLTGRRPAGLGAEMGSLSGAALGEHADEMRIVLARAMQENPYERYGTAQAFSSALALAAGVTETTVSLATRGVSAPAEPSVEPEVQVPAGGDDELPLAVRAAADQPAPDLVIQYDAAPDSGAPDGEHVLDEFPPESEGPSPGDSPREVARKMIAAREVRRRQVKKKTDKAVAAEVPAVPEEPVDGALFEAPSAESPPPDADASSPLLLDAVEDASTESVGTAPVGPAPEEQAKDDVAQAAALRAVDLALATRESSERVVAVDEFRAREVAAPRPERTWPRVPDRMAPARSESGRSDADDARPDRIASKVSAIESIDPDVLSMPLEEPPSDRQRTVMLPLALVLSLGLVLGYAAGYVVGSRETLASGGTSATPPSSAESQAPTMGRTAAKETTEQLVAPPVSTPAASPASSPASAPTVAAPAPAPAREARPAPTTGRLVISSNPAKAAVVINSKWSGRTPLTVDGLPFGRYVVRVVEPGYDVAREQLTLSSAAPSQTMDVTLRRGAAAKRAPAPDARAPQVPAPASPSATPAAPATGEIFVDSRPRGARVFINGKELGVTPLRLADQPVGLRVVRLELADHQSWTVTTEIVAQKTARVTGSLERIR